MRTISTALLMTVLVFFSSEALAGATVVVSDRYRAIYYQNDVDLKPDGYDAFDLDLDSFGDTYTAVIKTDSPDFELLILDGRDRDNNNLRPVPLKRVTVVSGRPIELGFPPSKSGLMGVLSNRGTSAAHASIQIAREGKRSRAVTNQIREIVSIPFEVVDHVYYLPPITVTVKPCGTANAFSTPDVIVCTELIADLNDKGFADALFPVLFHEIAHSILYAWELPGYDNEEMADEFAGMLLAESLPKSLQDYIGWLQRNDPVSEAVAQVASGDRHPLSIVRARNMQRIAANPEPVMRRWGRLMEPHMRPQPRPNKRNAP